MTGTGNEPIVFLAFAKQDNAVHRNDLRFLPDEIHGITDALKAAEKKGLCKVIKETYVTAEIIFDVFQQYKNRIAVFHYGGHANSYRLILQDYTAHKDGLVPFLSRQNGLSLVFLNGCSTAAQTRELAETGIPAVIGTYKDINDRVATALSIRFYKGIAGGITLESAFKDAVDYIITGKSGNFPRDFRAVNWKDKREPGLSSARTPGQFPWQLEYNKEAEKDIKQWTLPATAKDYSFGLPPIPAHIGYPKPPFRYLEPIKEKNCLHGESML